MAIPTELGTCPAVNERGKIHLSMKISMIQISFIHIEYRLIILLKRYVECQMLTVLWMLLDSLFLLFVCLTKAYRCYCLFSSLVQSIIKPQSKFGNYDQYGKRKVTSMLLRFLLKKFFFKQPIIPYPDSCCQLRNRIVSKHVLTEFWF